MKYIAFLILFPTFCLAQTVGNLKPYYFPYSNFFQPKTYKYVNANNPNDILYWHMQTKIVNNDTLFTTTIFDQDFYPLEILVEKISTQGARLEKYKLAISGIMTDSRLIHKDVFQWQQAKDSPIKWSALYKSPFGKESIRKRRTFLKTTKEFTFQKETYKTILFKDSFRHSLNNGEEIHTIDFDQETSYALGIGLVAYQRKRAKGKTMHYQLKKIINQKSWIKLKQNPSAVYEPIKRT
ncbi:hypothetical protein [Aureispira anguillae]|uniref:Uncharacterized protein n=1 Tax=Aureispira anguillae TaxID=2864201 RepID=A0A915YB01_9BACT|nr:hypothetical protein [Aureispira anguillae]BDS09755.1 hypothetical protein AsAng_0004600 [Aureispira anguillae]